jgi:hypothetical protein
MPHRSKKKRRDYKKKWTQQNKNKQKSYNQKYRQKVRDFYKELKENSFCVLCDESDIVEFHHLRDKEFSIYSGIKAGYSISRIKEELKKTTSVCRNCHAKIHTGRLGRNAREKYEKILIEFGVDYKYLPKEELEKNKEFGLQNIHNDPPKFSQKKPKKILPHINEDGIIQ